MSRLKTSIYNNYEKSNSKDSFSKKTFNNVFYNYILIKKYENVLHISTMFTKTKKQRQVNTHLIILYEEKLRVDDLNENNRWTKYVDHVL